jgi:2-amino-4-hydroxy-6-hydroxymethyldihydropteridine diphosphokinase
MNKTYLLLGSNMGNSRQQLAIAIKNITLQVGPILRKSKLYVTAAWGNPNQPNFLNQVIIVQTKLSAQQTIEIVLGIEKKMGRVRTKKNAPRIIDIDILFFNKEIIADKNLDVPHPQIENRRFVLTPLNELSPNFKHPIANKNIHQLLNDCKDTLDVKKF